MSSGPAVPVEIVDQILHFVPDNPDGRNALKSASLACRSFLPSARACLFQRIDLRDSDTQPLKLGILLQRAPHLVHYVQDLHIVDIGMYTSVKPKLFSKSTTLPTLLKALRNEGGYGVTLRRMELYGIDWKNMSSAMQAVLLDLLGCSSLRRVRFYRVSNCPANLIDCLPSSLKSLDISDTNIQLTKKIRSLLQLEALIIRLSVMKNNKEITGNALQTPEGLITRLQSLKLSTCDTTTWPMYRAIIQHASSSLEKIYIVINITAEQFESVDFGRYPRLRKIIIITPRLRSWLMCLASFRAAIIWLSRSLSSVSHDNHIDHVTIRFCVAITHGHVWDAPRFEAGIERATWKGLDETLSQPKFASSTIFQGMNLQICTDVDFLYEFLNGLVLVNLPKMNMLKKLHVTRERFSNKLYDIEIP